MKSVRLIITMPEWDIDNWSSRTVELFLPPDFLVLSETHTSGVQAYVRPFDLKNVLVFAPYTTDSAEYGTETNMTSVVANVQAVTISDREPDPIVVDIDTYPSPCVCVQTTDANQLAVVFLKDSNNAN